MPKFDEVLKALPTQQEIPSAHYRRLEVIKRLQAYFDNDFAQEFAELNSFAALQTFYEKLDKEKHWFFSTQECLAEECLARIKIKQAGLVPPSRWQEMDEHDSAWKGLAKWYGFSGSIQSKAVFLDTYQTWLNGEIKEVIKILLHHIASNNVAGVEAILKEIPLTDLNQSPFPLLFAARMGNESIVNLLLEKGIDAHVVDSLGETALHHAARSGKFFIVEKLLEKRVDETKLNGEGETALQIAAMAGYTDVTKLFLEGTPIGLAIKKGKTSLTHWAAAQGFAALIYDDSAYDKMDCNGVTPFIHAVQNGQLEVIKKLFPGHILVDTARFAKIVADDVDSLGRNALHVAADHGYVTVFNWLLEQGMNALAKDKNGKDCLTYALENGESKIIMAACKAKINRHALTPVDIQAILQAAYQNEDKETIHFFFGFIAKELMKENQNLYEKMRADIVDYNLIMPIDAETLARSTRLIDQKLQSFHFAYQEVAVIGKLSYMPGVSQDVKRNHLLRQATPRQLAYLRYVNKGFNDLVNDEKTIRFLVEAYALQEEYAAICQEAAEDEKQGKPPRSRFAKFYKAYLQTWIKPEHSRVNEIAEEFLHVIATEQDSKVKGVLARGGVVYIQICAFPLRLAARKGNEEYTRSLSNLNARGVPHWMVQGEIKSDYARAALVEAAKYNRVACVEILLSKTSAYSPELREALKVAAARGHLAVVKCILDSNETVGHDAVSQALVLASLQGQAAIVTELLTRYQRPGARYYLSHETLLAALKQAVLGNHVGIVTALLANHAFYQDQIRIELRNAWMSRYPDKHLMVAALYTPLLSDNSLSANNPGDYLRELFLDAVKDCTRECLTVFLSDPRIAQVLQDPPNARVTLKVASHWGNTDAVKLFNRRVSPHALFSYALSAWQYLQDAQWSTEMQLAKAAKVGNVVLEPWLDGNLQSLRAINGEAAFGQIVNDFCFPYRLTQETSSSVQYRIKEQGQFLLALTSALVEENEKQVSSDQGKRQMLALLKTGIAQLQLQRDPDKKLAAATYILVRSLTADKFNSEQALNLIQAYQAYVTPWWQTCAIAFVCIISGAIGLVLGAAAGIGIGMLAGSWTGPGMALTTLVGAMAGSIQGATLGVAAGTAVTALVTGTAGLLVAKGFFKTSEQQLAESVKQQAAYLKSNVTAQSATPTPLLAVN